MLSTRSRTFCSGASSTSSDKNNSRKVKSRATKSSRKPPKRLRRRSLRLCQRNLHLPPIDWLAPSYKLDQERSVSKKRRPDSHRGAAARFRVVRIRIVRRTEFSG